MKDKYIISVTGTQLIDGEKDSIKLKTVGEYQVDGNTHYIRYKEYDNENPNISFDNTVKVENGTTLTIIRSGPAQSRLILEKGRRHQCHYSTMFGDLMVGVFTKAVDCNLTEKGGTLHAGYTLDFNAGLVSENEIFIKVTEKEVN